MDEQLQQLISAYHDVVQKDARKVEDIQNAREKLHKIRGDRTALDESLRKSLLKIETEPVTKPTKLRSPRREELDSQTATLNDAQREIETYGIKTS